MMFGKEAEKLKSFLGAESEFTGELTSKGIMRIDGKITGKVFADQVIFSQSAEIKGEVFAQKIIVSGKIEGRLTATDCIEILAKGRVNGNIFTNKLVVMEGGIFNGRIEMKTDKPQVLKLMSA
jgi:cytoskeletal protein CcmA (bactofilin family)